MHKEDPLYDDRWKLNLGKWAHSSVHRSRNIMLYTWNLYDAINPGYLNKHKLKKERRHKHCFKTEKIHSLPDYLGQVI